MVTHDSRFARHADRTIHIFDGRVAQEQVESDPTLPVFAIRTMDELFHATVTLPRIMLTLLSVFAGLALLLAGIGLYGVLSYIVGVMPPAWRYPDDTDVWTPLRADYDKIAARGSFAFSGRAHLKPGFTLAQAQA